MGPYSAEYRKAVSNTEVQSHYPTVLSGPLIETHHVMKPGRRCRGRHCIGANRAKAIASYRGVFRRVFEMSILNGI